jgi:hypothetical protein
MHTSTASLAYFDRLTMPPVDLSEGFLVVALAEFIGVFEGSPHGQGPR